MAIDPMMLNPMLSPYENMVADLDGRGLSGEDADKVRSIYQRMQQLGAELSDIAEFTGICMQENLYTDISDYYTRALSSGNSGGGDSTSDYDDGALLKQSIQALKQSIEQIRQSKATALELADHDPRANLQQESQFAAKFAAEHGIDVTAEHIEKSQGEMLDKELKEKPNAYNNQAEVEALDNSEDLIEPIEALIALGEEPGMTFPKFLRLQIERGLDKAMEGAGVVRKSLLYDLDWAKAQALSPHHIKRCEARLSVFDDLANANQFGVPNSKELQWTTKRAERPFDQPLAKWDNIGRRWACWMMCSSIGM